jgi:hypothetical protein
MVDTGATGATGPAGGEGYTTSSWNDTPLYECSYCEFNTTDLGSITDHVHLNHTDERGASAGSELEAGATGPTGTTETA